MKLIGFVDISATTLLTAGILSAMVQGAGAQCVDCLPGGDAGSSGLAVGTGATSTGAASTAIGQRAAATEANSTAIGDASVASGGNGTAVGQNSKAVGPNSTAIGVNSSAEGNGTASGHNSRATGAFSTATGEDSRATDLASTATGRSAEAFGSRSTATGADSKAALNSTATGQNSLATGEFSTATGYQSRALRARSTANGESAEAYGENSSAYGSQAAAGGTSTTNRTNANTTALGAGAQAGALLDGQVNATAVGQGARSNALSATALGQGAEASAAGAVALGQGSVADIADTVSVGTATKGRRVVNLAPGDLTATSTDAVTGGQLFTTNANVTTLDSRVATAEIGIAGLDGRVTTAEGDIDTLQGQVAAGGMGLVQQDSTSLAVSVASASGGTLVDITGTNGARRLTGLADGTLSATSTDAVTGGQLLGVQGRIDQAFSSLGSGGFDSSGAFVPSSFFVQGASFDNVADALTSLDAQTTTNAAQIVALQGSGGGGGGGGSSIVRQASANGPITVGAAEGGSSVSLSGTDGTRRLTGLSAGSVTAGSTDAVTGAQVEAGQQSIASALGGRARVEQNGTISGVSYRIGDTEYGDIASAFGSLDTSVAGLRSQIAGFSTGSVSPFFSASTSRTAASATGTESLSLGGGSQASGADATAAGSNAIASGDGASAFGAEAQATQRSATAIGSGAVASHINSTAIGSGATTSRDNQVAVGTDASTYTMAGIASEESRAAQSGPVQIVTSDASGNLATTDFSSFFPDIEGLENRLNSHDRRFDRQADGIAIALALGGAYLPSDKDFALSGNIGVFDGSTALGMSGVARLDDNWFASGGVGVGFERSTVAGRAGVTFAW